MEGKEGILGIKIALMVGKAYMMGSEPKSLDMRNLICSFIVALMTIFASPILFAQSWAESMQEMLDQYPDSEGYQLQPAVIQEEVKTDCSPYKGGIHGGAQAYKTTIFGNGNKRDGIEDDREDVRTLALEGKLDHNDPVFAAGTIKCIGKNGGEIGSAEIINVEKLTGKGHSKGFSVGVTAAHVFIDEDGKSTRDCYYHPLNKPHERYKIKKKIVGEYYKTEDRADDWASFVLEEDLDTDYGAFQFGSLSDKNIQQFEQQGGEIHFVGYSHLMKTINLTRRNCSVVQRQPGDMRFSDNRVYTNSCDSNGGSSGGGLLANYADRYLLLGVNIGGIHKREAYPNRPMPGEPFDPKNNVNMTVKFQGKFLKAIKELAKNPIDKSI